MEITRPENVYAKTQLVSVIERHQGSCGITNNSFFLSAYLKHKKCTKYQMVTDRNGELPDDVNSVHLVMRFTQMLMLIVLPDAIIRCG